MPPPLRNTHIKEISVLSREKKIILLFFDTHGRVIHVIVHEASVNQWIRYSLRYTPSPSFWVSVDCTFLLPLERLIQVQSDLVIGERVSC